MKHKLQALPHFFTFTNIFLGFLSIVNVSQENYITGAWCIVIATIFDMLDGKIARWTKSYSRFGIELDSLADVVSFGVAPSFLIFKSNFSTVGVWGIFFSFAFLLAGVFRLARFNATLKGYSKKNFRGLPIPVAALGLASFMLMSQYYWGTVLMSKVYLVLLPVLALLMVSSIEYETIPPLRLSRSIKSNFKPLSYIVGFTCVFVYPKQAFFPGTMLYIVVGLFNQAKVFLQDSEGDEEVPVDEEEIVK